MKSAIVPTTYLPTLYPARHPLRYVRYSIFGSTEISAKLVSSYPANACPDRRYAIVDRTSLQCRFMLQDLVLPYQDMISHTNMGFEYVAAANLAMRGATYTSSSTISRHFSRRVTGGGCALHPLLNWSELKVAYGDVWILEQDQYRSL